MNDSTTEGKKVQVQIQQFARKLTKGLSKPKKKFVSQMLFGIQAARDVKLSNVARSLQEEIRLIKTEDRLSKHMMSKDLTGTMNGKMVKEGGKYVQEDTVLAIDLSDIYKPYARKMDHLAQVWDGSAGEVRQGYWLCEVIGANVDEEQIVPLYSESYSQKAKDFISENEQILTAIRKVNEYSQGKGIWTFDRGGDRPILVEEFEELKQRYVIRIKGTRDFIDRKGRKRKIRQILRRIRYTEKYKVKIDKEGYKEELEIVLGRRDQLWMAGIEVSLVVVKGFGREPMLLITNVKKDPIEILEIYLTRWKCEESFRFIKQEYHLEDVRVRRYKSIRNTVVLVHAIFYFVSVYLGYRLRMSILLDKILAKAKRFFEIPAFKHYAVADGIAHLLFNLKWHEKEERETENKGQYLLGFT